jgi:hypothetical protein
MIRKKYLDKKNVISELKKELFFNELSVWMRVTPTLVRINKQTYIIINALMRISLYDHNSDWRIH